MAVRTCAALAEAGVARVSVGGALAWVAWGAVAEAASELLASGTQGYADLAARRRQGRQSRLGMTAVVDSSACSHPPLARRCLRTLGWSTV